MTNVPHGQGAITLRHVPADRDGRARVVTSATYLIEDLRYSEDSAERVVDQGAAVIGSVSTLLTAGAGPGETDTDVVPVTSSVGVARGRPYLLVGADGRSELVSVRIVAGNNVYTHFELRNDFGTTDSLVSVEITATFPALTADDDVQIDTAPHAYQVTWGYTIDDEIMLVTQVVWLTRTTILAPFVSELDVLRVYPTIGPRLRNRADIADAIAVAHDDYLAEVRASGRNPEAFRANDTAKVAVRARALQYAFRWAGPADQDVREAEAFGSQYRYLMGQLLAGVPRPGVVTVDPATNMGGQDTKATHPIFTRR